MCCYDKCVPTQTVAPMGSKSEVSFKFTKCKSMIKYGQD